MIVKTEYDIPKKYAPVPIGNGDISLMIDYTGSNDCTDHVYSLHRAGVRQQQTNALLFPYGRITQRFCGSSNEIVKWSQSLNTENGLVSGRTVYKNGAILDSEVFCHLRRNIIGFRKCRINSPGDYTFRFEFGDAPRMSFDSLENGFQYFFDGIAEYRGKIRIYSDALLRFQFEKHVLSFSTSEQTLSFFLCFDNDPLPFPLSFDELLASSAEEWKMYWQESYIDIPDQELMRTYAVSKYHLRINQTRWSMPVGLFNTHFGGRYFAFDEFFCAHALASCGHFSLLKQIVDFRFDGLQWARYRASGYYHDSFSDARWPWETLENFEEGALCGHWQDHIFHMAHIALESWYYCCYSGDEVWLREKGLQILEGCAEYYMNQAVISLSSERKFITKCTDLERFGAGRENAYLTTCGVMCTLKIAAEAFGKTGYRPNRAEEYLKTALALQESLPQNGDLYFAIPANDQKSVAVLGGIYPYDNVMGCKNRKQRSSILDFMENDAEFGSMYPHLNGGTKLCRWYAGWESIVLSRYGETAKSYECLAKRAEDTGLFGQIYELYAPGRLPWFGTGEGIFIQAVNELLLPNSKSKNRRNAAQLWTHFSFKLRTRDGNTEEFRQ